jgi:hypothetical protein
MNLLHEQDFILENSVQIFETISSMKLKMSELITHYFKQTDEYEKYKADVSKINISKNIEETFRSLYCLEDIFSENINFAKRNSHSDAQLVASLWFQFSEYMPKFLTVIASSYESNEERFNTVKIVYEELGEGNRKNIHGQSFKRTCNKAKIKIQNFECKSLEILENFLESSPSDKKKLGIELGLKIFLNENIQTLFDCLSYNEKSKSLLKESYFFKSHYSNENEYISRKIQNYLSCKKNEDKIEFLKGFYQGIYFWKEFWFESKSRVKGCGS